MKTVCKVNVCTGCSVCLEVCNDSAITLKKDIRNYNAIIDETKCKRCGRCFNICQQNDDIILKNPIMWKQGWSKDESIRRNAASGGLATAIANSFIKKGGYVYGCLFENGDFIFKESPTEVDTSKFYGSKYIKSNPQGIFKKIKVRLTNGNMVLFIGLPCQVEAVKRFVGSNLLDGLYTIDLICHGTPSPKLLSLYLSREGYYQNQIKSIEFRRKNDFRLYLNKKSVTKHGVLDIFLVSFLKSLNYTDNCYECKFATIDRCSDLTLGDAWGSKLKENERKLGISLALVQSEKGKTLIYDENIEIMDISLETAISNNKQLKSPAKQIYRDKFFSLIKKGHSYNYAVFRCFPKMYIKQEIKKVLIKSHLWK